MKDRIEVYETSYNIYTDKTGKGNEVINVVYKENDNQCDIISFYKIQLDEAGEIAMRLSKLHNNVIVKLLKALRKDKNNPDIESVSESLGIDLKDRESSLNENNNITESKILKYWNKYCTENLPESFLACLVLYDGKLNTFAKDETCKSEITTLDQIDKFIKEKKLNIENLIGTPKDVITYDKKFNYFYAPLSDKISIASISNTGPIGIQLKEFDRLKNKLSLEEVL